MMIFLLTAPANLSAAINGTLVYGNTESSLFGGKIGITRDAPPWEYELTLNGAYGVAKVGDSSEVTANNAALLLRLDRYLTERVQAFLFASSEFNRVMNLENRSQGGAGAKYVFIKSENADFSVSAALLGGYERFVGDTLSRYPVRLSLRPKGRWNFGNAGTFSFVLFYQPNIQDFAGDYRVFGNATYSVSLTKALAFNFILKYNYDGYVASQSKDENSPLYGTKPYELNFLFGLSLNLSIGE
ncbi:MAG: DUF481 domain-containing protein [Thermotogae bacterium]|nr:DUF481 domain-containing protein [Thermotogota bacterium]